MKIGDRLPREQVQQVNNKVNDKKKRKRKRKEKVNWKEMMGINRDTYKRGKGGAMRESRVIIRNK